MADCTCDKCVAACKRMPGWFMPGEAEIVAEFLHLSLKELFKDYLIVNYYDNSSDWDRTTYVLQPAIKPYEDSSRNHRWHTGIVNGWPWGECVFLENDRCGIHAVKPFECKHAMCCNSKDTDRITHLDFAKVWCEEEHQEQIEQLLDRE